MGINLYNFISQVLTFLILLAVLWKFVFPVLIKTMDSRERTIREGVENAAKAEQDLRDAHKRVEALLEEARRDAQATLAKATQAADHIRAEIEQDAQQRAREIVTQAEQRTQQLVAQARAQLRQEVADLVIAAAEHVVGNSLDPVTSRRLVNEFVAQSRDVQC